MLTEPPIWSPDMWDEYEFPASIMGGSALTLKELNC
jgi:hypothetical protein